MLFIIGLGLHLNGVSKESLEILSTCKKVYLENYTVDFPYSKSQLSNVINRKIIPADREKVEGLEIVDEARKKDVAFLVYGSPLSATTHISLIQEAEASGVKYKVIHNASIFDAVAETGLQLYKFGKTTSMPMWKTSYQPYSFIDIIKQNKSIDAHTLILIDIGLDFIDALEQLEIAAKNKKLKLSKIIVCQGLGTKDKRIFYGKIPELRKTKVRRPYCIIVEGKLHFNEKEMLGKFSI